MQQKLADMALRIESARLLTYKAAALKDAGKSYTKVRVFCIINPSVSSQCVIPKLLNCLLRVIEWLAVPWTKATKELCHDGSW